MKKRQISVIVNGEVSSDVVDKMVDELGLEGLHLEKPPDVHQLSIEPEGHTHHHAHKKKNGHEHHHEHHHEHKTHEVSHHHGHGDSQHEHHRLKALLGLSWGTGLVLLSLFGIGLPIAYAMVLHGLTSIMTIYLGFNVYRSAWRALFQGKTNGETLYSISTLTLLVISIVSMFVPGLPQMLEAAPLILGFWHLGEEIEHGLITKIYHKLDVRECLPKNVMLKGLANQKVTVESLVVNDIIVLERASVIPVDGVLMQDAYLYTTRVDGSPHLQHVKKGDTVKSGMQLASKHAVEMRVGKSYQNSYLSLVAANVKKANLEKAPIEAVANKVYHYFIPSLLAIAAASGLVLGFLYGPAIAIECVASVLVSACPCVLSLITPMAVRIGMSRAAELGVQFKNGKALQASADIDVVVFDLNGTLTKGDIELESYTLSDEKYFAYIALLERHGDHPVAHLLSKRFNALSKKYSAPLSIKAIDDSHHAGMKAVINGELFMMGTRHMLADNGITDIKPPYNNPNKGGIYAVCGQEVVGQLSVIDPLRDDAIGMVGQLKALGKSVHICTGADRLTAKRYAKELGIPLANVSSNTVGAVSHPGEISKQHYLKKLKDKKLKVAMVGDAANDAEAIAYADIGIAIKSKIGDSVTEAHAGMVIKKGALSPIATAFDVAKKTNRNIYQNLFISFSYNSVITVIASGLLIGLGVTLNPAVGVALMVLESSLVLGNLYSLRSQDIINLTDKEVLHEVDTTTRLLGGLDYRLSPSEALSLANETPAISPVANDLVQPDVSRLDLACHDGCHQTMFTI